MQYQITIPQSLPEMTVKELLEQQLLIPRKIRHFLRTKKHVTVNDRSVNWQSLVRPGDLLLLTFDREDYPSKEILAGNPKLVDCLYEDQHLIIVNKPEGMKTHPNAPDETALLNHVSSYVGQTCYVVHRLDKETSGAILFAKNPFILPIINRLLEERKVSRTYLALCHGNCPKDSWTITDPIGRHRHDRRKRIVEHHKGRPAVTHIELVKKMQTACLLSCRLETGRTHQIRVHLAHHGLPIIGDPLYSQHKACRLMLHAQSIQLIHPLTLEKLEIEAPSPRFDRLLTSMEADL